MTNIFYCNDIFIKKHKIRFSSGSLNNDDTWLLCHNCNKKPEFQCYRISETFLDLGDCND